MGEDDPDHDFSRDLMRFKLKPHAAIDTETGKDGSITHNKHNED